MTRFEKSAKFLTVKKYHSLSEKYLEFLVIFLNKKIPHLETWKIKKFGLKKFKEFYRQLSAPRQYFLRWQQSGKLSIVQRSSFCCLLGLIVVTFNHDELFILSPLPPPPVSIPHAIAWAGLGFRYESFKVI